MLTKLIQPKDAVVVRNPHIRGGRPVFRGTLVPAEALFKALSDGYSLGEVIEAFPALTHADCRRALIQAGAVLMQVAPEVRPEQAENGA
jgi:uncharacterized protein (DUF433 family)